VYTASGSCGAGGAVYYYRTNAGSGSEPTTKPVSGVPIGPPPNGPLQATTDGSGAYALSSLYGHVQIATLKKWGTPRAADHNGAVSALDASTIARKAVGLITFSANQVIAGDVTGDTSISALDASQVARFAVGAVSHFDVATDTLSDWRFLRCDDYVFPGAPGCVDPLYDFNPIAQPETARNFHAVLYGDVTGNWQPAVGGFAASRAAISPEESEAPIRDREIADRIRREGIPPEVVRRAGTPPAEISIVGWKPLRAGERRQLTVDLRNADGILGLDLVLSYDPSRLAIVGVNATGIGSELNLAHADVRGVQRIAAYGYGALSGSGSILTITVEGLSNKGPQLPPTIGGKANEGAIPLVVKGRGQAAPARK
jgi:hypothetical protein